MKYVRLAEFPSGTDLSPVTEALTRHGIQFRLEEEQAVIVLHVDADAHIGEVVAQVRAAMDSIARQQEELGIRSASNPGQQLRRTPGMAICLLLSILGALLVSWRFELVHWFTFVDFQILNTSNVELSTLQDTIDHAEYWRLVTPIFIHFGLFHIAFNGLWLWEFGRRVETLTGTGHFLIMVIVVGVSSNCGQYFWGGPSLFGGMSGVIYGLLGYIWIRHKVAPSPVLALPKGIVGFMLVWLLVCMSGVMNFLGLNIANAAHASGLLTGMVLGAVFGFSARQAAS